MQEQLQRITKLETELASLNQRFSEWADISEGEDNVRASVETSVKRSKEFAKSSRNQSM